MSILAVGATIMCVMIALLYYVPTQHDLQWRVLMSGLSLGVACLVALLVLAWRDNVRIRVLARSRD